VFGDRKPTSTGVQVAALLRPGALIEISAMAFIPDKAV
jgi:enamine deaminase RidA (YjgF/YER057c/UK114 family)